MKNCWFLDVNESTKEIICDERTRIRARDVWTFEKWLVERGLREKWLAGENPGRDFMYTSRGTGNGYTSDITDCYCTLARFYMALKILFVVKFLRSRPPGPVARSSRMHAASFVHDKRKDDSEWFTNLRRARSLFTFGLPFVEFFPGSSDF